MAVGKNVRTRARLRAASAPGAPPLIVIVGPTASGKSNLAIRIAKRIGGEIIAADSRQIYRGLEIGSAATVGRRRGAVVVSAGIPHHLVSVLDPRRAVSAGVFAESAHAAIRTIAARGRIPILVGGTGFWIDAVARGMRFPPVPPDDRLRKRLSAMPAPALFAMLQTIDARRASDIESKNPRRLIRAIEVARALGRVPARSEKPRYRSLWIGIDRSDRPLLARIQKRAFAMVRRGLVREVRALEAKGVPDTRIREFGFEYRSALAAARGGIPRAELVRRIIRDTRRYVRRQRRWWRRNRDIQWFRSERSAVAAALRFTRSLARKKGRQLSEPAAE